MNCVCCGQQVELGWKQRAYVHKDNGSLHQFKCSCGWKGDPETASSMFSFGANCCPSCGRGRLKIDHSVIAVTEMKPSPRRFMLPDDYKPRRFNYPEMQDIKEYGAIGVVLDSKGLRGHPSLGDPRHYQIADLRDRCTPKWSGRRSSDTGVAGLLTDIHILLSAKKKVYAKATLTDMDYNLRLLIWPGTYKECWAHLTEFNPVVVVGKWETLDMADPTADYTGWDNMEMHVDELRPYNYWATER